MKKITVLVEDDLYEDMQTYIQWGLRRHVLSTLITMAVDVAKNEGQVGIAALIQGSFSLKVKTDNAKT